MTKPFFKALAALMLGLGAVLAAGAVSATTAEEARNRIRDGLQNDPAVPKVEPAGYDATIIVFSDYQCPYCHQLHPRLQALLREDPKLRIVYRDWPIFGAASTEAARAAIAARYQGEHEAFNDTLLSSKGRLTSEGIRAAAASAGVDWARLQADMTRHRTEIDGALQRTEHYARLIGLSGTPALIVDSYLFPGAVSTGTLKAALRSARLHVPFEPE